MDNILEIRNISKEFPGVKALQEVDFHLRRGEVHALVGENGAGKSTLMKILSGIYKPDSGEILLNGKPYAVSNTRYARDRGISMIYQEFNLLPHLTVAENIFVAREPRKYKFLINDSKMKRETQSILDELELDISPSTNVSKLSVAEKQMVEITKALVDKSEILILDEPTSALSDKEVQKLFSIIRKLKSDGVSIIYISHRLEELKVITDRVTVMRDGRHIETNGWENFTMQKLITLMVGRSIEKQYPKHHAVLGEIVLEARNFRNNKLKNASLSVRSGEILGLAGLMGAGRTEFARAIFGADKIAAGEILIRGRKKTINNTAGAVRNHIAYLSEDRKTDGLMLDLEVDTNILLGNLQDYATAGVVNDKKCRAVVSKRIDELLIKTPSPRQIVKFLSGGNQQKVLIARWLCRNSEVIIFDEPTRGIDVGAKYEVYSLMNALVESGAAIIMISSEMTEILGMSDRIIVMSEGETVGEIGIKDATQEKILQMASKVHY